MGRFQERLKEYFTPTTGGMGNEDKTSIEYTRERLEIDLRSTQKSLERLQKEVASGALKDPG